MPRIEQEIGFDPRAGRRLLLGESMGGFNTIQLAFKTTLFSKVAALCAPLSEISPFASEQEIQRFVEGTHAWQYYKNFDPALVLNSAQRMIAISRAFFPTPADWESADPLRLAANAPLSHFPALYLAVGFYDQYANYEGNQRFAETLTRRGAVVEWRPQWGGHCAIDILSLAVFL